MPFDKYLDLKLFISAQTSEEKEELTGVIISIMEENHKMILKSLGATNAIKLVKSSPTVRQIKNGRRKVKRKEGKFPIKEWEKAKRKERKFQVK